MLFVSRITIRRLASVVVVGVTGSLFIASAAITRLPGSTAILFRLLNICNMVETTLVFDFDHAHSDSVLIQCSPTSPDWWSTAADIVLHFLGDGLAVAVAVAAVVVL